MPTIIRPDIEELYQKLNEAEDLEALGAAGISHQEMISRLREKLIPMENRNPT